ncbi:MAG: exonuclease domain-containing protein [Ktedonobacterales bacterium]
MPGQTPPVRVAIDLETTGLHPEQDAIIEIGAVRFVGADVLDTFESFVSPGLPIPYRVQRLTGITSTQLRDAPSLATLLPRLRAFIDEVPLVGHSVPFDAAFLRRAGLARRNPLVDTFELASALLPDLPSYSLGAVGQSLGVKSPTYHRALADAQLSMEVFLALLKRLEELDASTIEGLGRLAAPPDWTPSYFVRAAVREQRMNFRNLSNGSLLTGLASSSLGDQLAAKLGMDPAVLSLAITPQGPVARMRLVPASMESTAQTENGSVTLLPDHIAAKPSVSAEIQSQAQTALERTISYNVSETLSNGGGPLLVELQHDGIGTVACLASALTWAREQPPGALLISVADQENLSRLVQHNLPRAFEIAGLAPDAVGVAELTERETYLCLHRWFGIARTSHNISLSQEMARGLAKLTVWAGRTETGARGEVALAGPELVAWERVRSGKDFADSITGCTYRRDGYCFVARAQQAARDTQVILTTHTALAAHLIGSDDLLPATSRVLVLDAHLLEEELRRVRSKVVEQSTLSSLLHELAELQPNGKRAGLLHLAAERLEDQTTKAPSPHREKAWFAQVDRAQRSISPLFQALYRLLGEAQSENGRGSQSGEGMEQRMLRLDTSVSRLSAWEEVVRDWTSLDSQISSVTKLLHEVALQLVAQLGKKVSVASDGLATDLFGSARLLEQVRSQVKAVLTLEGNETDIAWLRLPYPGANGAAEGWYGRRSTQQNRKPTHVQLSRSSHETREITPSAIMPMTSPESTEVGGSAASLTMDSALLDQTTEVPVLHSAPVQVGQSLEALWAPDRGLILAAPALAVAGDFTYTTGSLALPPSTQTLSPAMDRSEQTILCLPTDVPEPNAPQYQRHLDDMLIRLATVLHGDLVVVFPSHAALRASASSIRRALEKQLILLMAQGQDGSVRQLWQTFRSEPRVVLLGAGAFWDGAIPIDHPPACVVIPRTPFPALSDPLLAARADTWNDQQNQFLVPHAALKLRQALGGLAWSHWRRNAVVLFDHRLQTRGYGSTVLGTLPRCRQFQEPVARVIERIEEWI